MDTKLKDIANDDFFGRPSFSDSEESVVFIGEMPDRKYKAFWEETEQEDKEEAKEAEKEGEKEGEKDAAKKGKSEAIEKFRYE